VPTITVTPEPAYGSVRIEVEHDSGGLNPVQYLSQLGRIDPSVDGPAPPVRTMTDQLPAQLPIVLRDFEVPFGVPVQYLATWYTMPDDPQILWSDEVTLDPPAGMAAQLSVVGQPDVHVQLPMLLTYDAEHAGAASVVWPINGQYPLYSIGPTRARTGSMTTVVGSMLEVSRIRQVYDARQPVLLRQTDHPALDMYHVSTGLRHRPADPKGREWLVEIDYAEVARPSMSLVSTPGWTYAALAEAYDTYAEVTTSFDEYTDLAIGPLS